MYSIDLILEKDSVIKETKVELGKEEKVQIVPTEDVKILNNNNKEKRNVTYKLKLDNITSPVKKGDIVGKIEIVENDKVINVISATVKDDVEKANLFTVYYRNLKKLFAGF